MKAVQKIAPGVGNVEVRDVPEPTPGPGQVVLEVAYTGICGTDLHIYLDEYRSVPPVTLGHEVSARVVELGPGVEGWRVGERVVPETYFHTCNRCRHCAAGRPNLCPERRSIGTHVNGGFARYLLVPAARLHRVPDGVDDRTAAMAEPLACCIHGLLDRASILPGDLVVVSGPGPIGLLCLQVARAAGATALLVGVDGDEARLEIGRQLGADRVVNAAREPLADIVADLSQGAGADVAVEAAGVGASFNQCLELVRRGGTVLQVGLYGRRAEVDLNTIAMKELRVAGTFAHVPPAWERALRLFASGAVRSEPLITDVAPLAAFEAKIQALRAKRECKVLLRPAF